jgi:hypothetical protein
MVRRPSDVDPVIGPSKTHRNPGADWEVYANLREPIADDVEALCREGRFLRCGMTRSVRMHDEQPHPLPPQVIEDAIRKRYRRWRP